MPTISIMIGAGSIKHNARNFIAENVDKNRIGNNVQYCNEDIRKVYHALFDFALTAYNAGKKKTRDKIPDYYEHICNGKQEKPFHEIVVQIGDRDSMGFQSGNSELAKSLLDEYYRGFQERNPQLRVFSAHLHMDESTPHLHIDFVPYTTGSKRGLSTRVSLKQALSEQGFKGGSREITEWSQWTSSEKESLGEIMRCHGVEWEHKDEHRKHLSVLDYKKQQRGIEIKNLNASISQLKEKVNELDSMKTSLTVDTEKLSEDKKQLISKVEDEDIKLQTIASDLNPMRIEYNAQRYLKQCMDSDDITRMYPDFVKVKHGFLNQDEYVVVPKDKWESLHITAKNIKAIKKQQKEISEALSELQNTPPYQKVEYYKSENQRIEEKHRIFADESRKKIKNLNNELTKAKKVLEETEKELKNEKQKNSDLKALVGEIHTFLLDITNVLPTEMIDGLKKLGEKIKELLPSLPPLFQVKAPEYIPTIPMIPKTKEKEKKEKEISKEIQKPKKPKRSKSYDMEL